VVSLAVQERARVGAFLQQAGVKFAPSKGNFLFFDCGVDASAFAEELLKRGVIVKPWKQRDYQTFVRVSIGSVDENEHFMEAVTALLPALAASH
jgi:histidinol-phosphate aminotransferase